ncbi:MAG: FAD-binding oxidoreductase [Bradymonadaceae bacterium]|nr:FAD-binding oxidoreductase [Lujinxingiaceae bacterium]
MTRRLSHWGWGYADRFTDREGRAQFAQMVEQMLGFAALSPEEPVSLEAATLAQSRLAIAPALSAILSDAREERITHTYGKAYRDLVRGFYGDFGSAPDLVARPRNETEVVDLLDWASAERVAVIPFGGGTSVVGGVEPAVEGDFSGTLSLDMRAMGRVLEVDPISRAARIEAGATGPELERQLEVYGLSLRHYPQSFEFSTLGGWLATRAGGHFATVYTHIDDFVESMRIITPSGLVQTPRLPASGAGPSPDRLWLGSEGALGIITEAWMRIRPRPLFRARANVLFSDYARAVEATRRIAQAYLHPSNCRLLDKREAMLNAVVFDGSHVLLLGFESAEYPQDQSMTHALELCLELGGRCPDGAIFEDHSSTPTATRDAGSRWRQAFFDAPYLQNNMVSLGVIADTFETACTWDRFEAMHAHIIGSLKEAMKRVCKAGMITCRFTHVYPDGPAPYYTFVAPAVRGSELSQWAELKAAACEALQAEGGTITHHHAVGRLHRPWYENERPELFASALGAVKRELDPAGILNPGVLLAERR